MHEVGRIRAGWTAAGAILCTGAVLALGACGGEEDAAEEGQPATAPSAETEEQPTETMAQPPPETEEQGSGAEGSARSGPDGGESRIAESETGPQPCPDVVVTPDSGNGLFAVESEGITCDDASAALEAWGASGYPGEGPPGFDCRETAVSADGSARLSCVQEASGGVVEFDTGG